MTCHDFEIRLERLLDEALDPVERTRCLEHAEQCRACNELLSAVRGPALNPVEESPDLLVDAVLDRTTGPVCGQAEERLPSLVDRELSADDRGLVEAHLHECSDCRQLMTTLERLRRQLPDLAEMPPDEQFTAQVLSATLPVSVRLRRWLVDRTSSWVRRPRFAMEAAYAGLLVIMLVLGAFSTPLAALPQKGIDLVQPEPGTPSVWSRTGDSLGTFWERVASLFEKVEKDKNKTRKTP